MNMAHGLGAVLLLVAVWGSPGARAEICSDDPGLPGVTAYCGFVGPEDIVRLDDTHLIISTMEPADYLYGFDTVTGEVTRLDTRLTEPAPTLRWGDPACPVPTSMVSHGLDLSLRADGERQLLVVSHGERESIEYFSIDAGAREPVLQWRGCVEAADNAQFNDVAGLPDGGFLATDPITASWQLMRMIMGSLGMATGKVYRWRPELGYEAIPHTEGAYPNGILLSADGKSFYLNLYLDGEVREHALEDGSVLNRTAVEMPDNSSLSPEGHLLVASHHAGSYEIVKAIMAPPGERISIAFDIVEIDPDVFEPSVRYRSDGHELGGGTIAEAIGDVLYIGSFRGDRIIRVVAPSSL